MLVGVDGSQGGRVAVALTRRLTATSGELTLAQAYPYHGDPPLRGYDDDEAAQIIRARELLHGASEELEVDAQLRWTSASRPAAGSTRWPRW